MKQHVHTAPAEVTEMTAALQGMIRRVRRLIVLRGVSLAILVGLAGLAAAMTVDGVGIIYAAWARWALALLTYGAAAGVVVWTILRPLSQTFTPAGLARVIERRHPELHERISSAVELESAVGAPGEAGSSALILALGREAALDIRHVDPKVEISIRKVARFLAAVAVALATGLGIMLYWPETAGRLALRSALPVLNLPNIHAGQLVVDPGDTVILKGDRLRAVLTSSRSRLPNAYLLIQVPGERAQSIEMNRVTDGDGSVSRFSLVTEPVTADFRYRIRGGDAVTREYRVTVTPRPEILHLDILYAYPDYTGREPLRTRVVDGDIRAVAGTEVTVRATFSKPLSGVDLRINGRPVSAEDDPQVRLRHAEPDVAEFRMPLSPGMQSVWSIGGTDAFGFRGYTREYALQAVDDAVPEVEIIEPPDARLVMRPDDRLILRYVLRDDFGMDTAGLVLETDGQRLPIRPVVVPVAARQAAGELVILLADLPLRNARALRMQMRARDRRPVALGGPQIGRSKTLHIDLDAGAKPLRVQLLDAQTQQVRKELETARLNAGTGKQALSQLHQVINRSPDDNALRDAARQALAALEKVDHALESAGNAMRGGFYDGLRKPLAEDAGAPLDSAAETVAHIPVTEDHPSRESMSTAATADLERADLALDGMLTRLDDMHRTLQEALVMRELAERQAEMAAAMDAQHRERSSADARPDGVRPGKPAPAVLLADEEASPPDAIGTEEHLAHLQAQQERLAGELAGLIGQIPDAARVAADLTREQLEQMAAETEKLRRQQQEWQKRTDEAEHQAEAWETAANGLAAQYAALAEAKRDLLLPKPPVPLAEVAADLAEGRLREAAGKMTEMADELNRRLESLERERQTETLAERLRSLHDDFITPPLHEDPESEAPLTGTTPSRDRLAALAERLDELEAQAQEATPLARKAFRHNPAEDLRDALAENRDLAGVAETAQERIERLQQALESAARAARAERLAERIEEVAGDLDTMETLAGKSRELSTRMAEAVEPWSQALETAATEADAQATVQQHRQAALAEDVADLQHKTVANPVTADIPLEPLREALAPTAPPGRLSPPEDQDRLEQAAAAARQAARDIDDNARKAQDNADAAVRRARAALDEAAEAAHPDLPREARWRLDEAEEARERERRRVDEAMEIAMDLDRLGSALAELAEEQHATGNRRTEIADDQARLADARTLATQAADKASAAEREAERLRQVQEALEAQQAAMLSEPGAPPATDARTLAAQEREQVMPAAAEAMLELAAAAAEIGRRQVELADAMAEAQAAGGQPPQQEDAVAQAASSGQSQDAAAPSEPQAAAPSAASAPQPSAPPADGVQDARAAQLAATQRELAQETARLKQEAAELAADARPVPMPRPEEAMHRAAHALDTADIPTAEKNARQAAVQQEQLAQGLAERAAAIPPDARQAAASPPPSAPPSPPPSAPEMPDLQTPPAQQAAMQQHREQSELTGETLTPEAEVIPNIGHDQDQVEYDLGHTQDRPEQQLPPDFDLGRPTPGAEQPYNMAGSPDVPVPPVPPAPRKETMSGPVPFSDPVQMTQPITELPKILMPDRFPQTFAGEFSDRPVPPPPPEKSSSLAPAPRLKKSDLEDAKKEFAELSAIHIDDSPHASDMGGQAIEEIPDEILLEPGAQYSKGAPGQSAMPGMELGQLSQAENQDQQSPSPAQPPLPSAGGSGGGEDANKPPAPSPPKPPSSEASPPSPPGSGSSSGSSGTSGSPSPDPPPPSAPVPGDGPAGTHPGGSTGMQPPSSSPPPETASPMPSAPGPSPSPPADGLPGPSADPGGAVAPSPAAEAERLRSLEQRLDPGIRSLDALPADGAWRSAMQAEPVSPAAVGQLLEELRQLDHLVPQLFPGIPLAVGGTRTTAGEMPTPQDAGATLPRLAEQVQSLGNAIATLPSGDVTAMPAPEHRSLAEALGHAGRAALTGDPRAAEEAALRMAQTAKVVQERAESMGLTLEPRVPDLTDGGIPPDDELLRLGVPVSDWLRLPGELRSEVLQARPAEGPEEYRALIRRYFSGIAREREGE